ncbi:hypothetical protein ANN_11113 [Periplaneta americana]|uniref:Mos1 transposase HTH domain-containing protein n=1 Tax=Periplaneta americana TaxID=6978 RepID=A0ABQ8T5D6_PERAM|nr:hypothetical protein ANN_11113 [Periplaneta americana]
MARYGPVTSGHRATSTTDVDVPEAKAAKAARNIVVVYGDNAIGESTTRKWFVVSTHNIPNKNETGRCVKYGKWNVTHRMNWRTCIWRTVQALQEKISSGSKQTCCNRLKVKQWQVRGNKNKEAVETRKLDIQQKFWRELGLRVDHPKPGGSGTSNYGNTVRTFFNREDISSEITGLDREINHRFGIVLKTISSGFTINTQAFEYYARKTAEHYISLYPWYYMPASVHKVLIRGSTIISSAILPIGQMSEEAQEARNKRFKEYRESHSRKISREATNVDVMHRLLETSDPVISSLRKQLQMKPRRKNLPREVTDLLCSETHPQFGYTVLCMKVMIVNDFLR